MPAHLKAEQLHSLRFFEPVRTGLLAAETAPKTSHQKDHLLQQSPGRATAELSFNEPSEAMTYQGLLTGERSQPIIPLEGGVLLHSSLQCSKLWPYTVFMKTSTGPGLIVGKVESFSL